MLTEQLLMEKYTPIQPLWAAFSDRLQEDVLLAGYTAARIGGPADVLLEALSADDLFGMVSVLWELDLPFVILGGGSNVLISDYGVRGVVVMNRARQLRFDEKESPPHVWAESGVNFGSIARRAALRGLAGLEWAAGIPGTLGGAVVGNAGAHSGDVSQNLIAAEILHRSQAEQYGLTVREEWTADKLGFSYRSSALKHTQIAGSASPHHDPGAVVLSAGLRLERSTPQAVQDKMDEYAAYRRKTQPPGASMGSMFKNPPGDYAGRLIENAGLKGSRIGGAEISTTHANFFVNLGHASASDVTALIKLAHDTVAGQFGVDLELEIELMGDFQDPGKKQPG